MRYVDFVFAKILSSSPVVHPDLQLVPYPLSNMALELAVWMAYDFPRCL